MNHITNAVGGWTAEINGMTAFIPNDPENEQCREILALIEGGMVVAEPAVIDLPKILTKTEFCRALYHAKILPEELVVDTALGKWPSTFEAAIAGLPEPARVDAKLAWAGAVSVSRNAPLFLQLLAFFAALRGLSTEQADLLGDQIFAQAK